MAQGLLLLSAKQTVVVSTPSLPSSSSSSLLFTIRYFASNLVKPKLGLKQPFGLKQFRPLIPLSSSTKCPKYYPQLKRKVSSQHEKYCPPLKRKVSSQHDDRWNRFLTINTSHHKQILPSLNCLLHHKQLFTLLSVSRHKSFTSSPLPLPSISLTTAAAQRLKELANKNNKNNDSSSSSSSPSLVSIAPTLRVKVSSGGCAGFQYEFELITIDKQIDPNTDRIIEDVSSTGCRLVVDLMSVEFLQGCVIGYLDEMIQSGFQVQSNKSASSTCSCGHSFEVVDQAF
eukprot:GHVS01020855.1.p1 GENE.GHVS01020855.1~~GHVS01020855.1.p1  ORF type:complete len:285 (+),score=60.32 GHVS01020855.1:91-945(+)